MMKVFLLSLLLAMPVIAEAAPVLDAVTTDPVADPSHPAALSAFVIPSGDGALNAVMYTAAGAGPHPTLLLLHGFPGNEQNLDLAQAARRAGWNVLTFHYRGTWGSPGAFSLAHELQDAKNAMAFLRSPAADKTYGIDPARIAIAGHSMGGMMAADVAAHDPKIIGTFLLDPVDLSAVQRSFSDPKQREQFKADLVGGNLAPLSGTSENAVMTELAKTGPSFDLVKMMPALAGRPLSIIGTQRGLGVMSTAAANAARAAGATHLDYEILPTDHSFSDKRIAISDALVTWLATLK